MEIGTGDCIHIEDVNSELLRYVNRQLTKINTEIHSMDPKKLKLKLMKYDLNLECDIDDQRKSLKLLYQRVKLTNLKNYVHEDILPYYVVIDYEATCEGGNPPNFRHEIIEFPAVLINTKTLEIEDTFRRVCKPTINPNLSQFCSELTGITQEEINDAEDFSCALLEFETWLKSHQLGDAKRFVVVTDGPWDITRFLYGQCIISNIALPNWARQWVNIRRVYSNFYRRKKVTLASMLEDTGMTFEGRKHCGLDDSKNISKILVRLICDGANIQVNEAISPSFLNSLNLSLNEFDNELERKMNDLNLDGGRLPLQSKDELGTFECVKMERYKREVKLALMLKENLHAGVEIGDINVQVNVNNIRKTNNIKVPTKKKKKKKLCH